MKNKNIVNFWNEIRKHNDEDLYIIIDKEKDMVFVKELKSDKIVGLMCKTNEYRFN